MKQHNIKERLSETQRAYIAGFIDADGTISLSAGRKRKSGEIGVPMPLVLIVNTDFRIIKFMKEATGVGCSYFTNPTKLRKDQDKRNWNPVHRFQVTGMAAIELIEAVMPYLMLKTPQAKVMIQAPQRGRDFPQFATDEQVAFGKMLKEEMLELNKRKLKTAERLGTA